MFRHDVQICPLSQKQVAAGTTSSTSRWLALRRTALRLWLLNHETAHMADLGISLNSLFDRSQAEWSFRSVELPFVNGHGNPDHHCFLALVSGDVIVDELHFVPVDSRGQSISRQKEGQANTNSAGPYLGTACYLARRNFQNLSTVIYESGSASQIVNVWTAALRAALQIADIQRPFELGDCRAGAKGVVTSLGYTFSTFTAEDMQHGLNTNLAAVVTLPATPGVADDRALIKDYRIARQALMVPRTHETAEESRMGLPTSLAPLGAPTANEERVSVGGTRLKYDDNGKLSQVTRPDGTVRNYAAGVLVSEAMVDGSIARFAPR